MRRAALPALLVALMFQPAVASGDDERVKRGFENLQALRCDSAIRNLTGPFIEAMKVDKADSRAKAARYLMLIGSGFRYDDNVQAYLDCARMARALAPDDPDVIAFNIFALIRSSEYDKAKALVAQYKSRGAKHPYFVRASATYSRALGNALDAEAQALRCVALNPQNAASWLFLSSNARSRQDTIKFLSEAKKLMKERTYEYEYHSWMIEKATNGAKADLQHILKARQLRPDEPNAHRELAFAYLALGKLNEGEPELIAATQTPRLSLKALSELSAFWAFSGRPKLAVKAATRVVELAPDLPESYLARGHVHNAAGDPAAAEKDFLRALVLNPHYSAAYEAIYSLPSYSEGEKSDRFIAEWNKQCPSRVNAILALGDRERRRCRWASALSAYESALSLLRSKKSPEKFVVPFRRALVGAGISKYKLGDLPAAIEHARGFNERKARNSTDLIRVRLGAIDFARLKDASKEYLSAEHAVLADMLYECGDMDGCVAEYKKAIAMNDNPEWHRGLLKAYMDKGDIQGAMKEDLVVANNTVTKDLPGAMDNIRRAIFH